MCVRVCARALLASRVEPASALFVGSAENCSVVCDQSIYGICNSLIGNSRKCDEGIDAIVVKAVTRTMALLVSIWNRGIAIDSTAV